MALILFLSASLVGCSSSADTSSSSPPAEDTAGQQDTGPAGGIDSDGTGSSEDTGNRDDTDDTTSTVDAPSEVVAEELVGCEHAPPDLALRYVGASPHVASVPIAVIDGVNTPVEGFCLEQTFQGGGVQLRCGRTELQEASAYLQGAPAPGQAIDLRLGVILENELCWAPEPHTVLLGTPAAPGFGYTPLRAAPSTPDYPPAAMGVTNTEEGSSLYAMALLDSPDFGIRAGDILWSYAADAREQHLIEVHRLGNGLLTYTSETGDGNTTHAIYEPDFAEVRTAAIDAAGFSWLNRGACESPEDADCFGFIHHGNAALPGSPISLTMGYERLLDASGAPYTYPQLGGYSLVGATFQGHHIDHQGGLEKVFELSFHDLFDMDPDLAARHGTRFYEGPVGETYRSAYYVNSADVTRDRIDPDLYHLTGTLTVSPFNGFYHVLLTADGQVVDAQLYNDRNDELDWGNALNRGPLDSMGHSVEHIGRDSEGREHFLVYDRRASRRPSDQSGCAAFYHVVDDAGTLSVGGPYHNLGVTGEEGALCGNSMSYGNASALYGLTIDGYPEPVDLVVNFDNVALPEDQGGAWPDILTTYLEGTPRLMGLYLNEDRFAPHDWESAGMFLGRNIAGNDPVGFNSLIQRWPSLLVSDRPFHLEGL